MRLIPARPRINRLGDVPLKATMGRGGGGLMAKPCFCLQEVPQYWTEMVLKQRPKRAQPGSGLRVILSGSVWSPDSHGSQANLPLYIYLFIYLFMSINKILPAPTRFSPSGLLKG